MKPYTATFKNKWGEKFIMSCVGKNDTQANANAVTKFRRTIWHKWAPDAWTLVALRRSDWATP